MRRRRRWLSWWLINPADAPERIARDALRLPGRVWRSMGSANRAALIEKMTWTEPKADCEQAPFPSFRHRRRTYLLPRPKFENGTCLDFVLADGYFQAWMSTGDPAQLLRLVATLCREPRRDKREALTTGDERVPLRQKEEVEHRARRLDGLPPEITASVMLYFAGVKEYVARTYWVLFDSPNPTQNGEGEGDTERDRDGDGPKFGWWSVFLQVAETGIFGQYEEVLQRRLHLVCVHLTDQHDRQEKQKRAYERERSKLKS